jgi:hypothetical protein
MRENQSLIDIIGWLLIGIIAFCAVMLFSGCGTVRQASNQDAAGSQVVMYHKSHTLEAKHPLDTFYLCDHFWVNQAVPQKDSTLTYSIISYTDRIEGINWGNGGTITTKVTADKICICIYCHELNICF